MSFRNRVILIVVLTLMVIAVVFVIRGFHFTRI